ncbi:MAG: hypothetical protein R3Y33_04765 [Clostridia bacterium]
MKGQSKLIVLFSILFGVIALVATLTTALILIGKKKEETELERYLDCSIQ